MTQTQPSSGVTPIEQSTVDDALSFEISQAILQVFLLGALHANRLKRAAAHDYASANGTCFVFFWDSSSDSRTAGWAASRGLPCRFALAIGGCKTHPTAVRQRAGLEALNIARNRSPDRFT